MYCLISYLSLSLFYIDISLNQSVALIYAFYPIHIKGTVDRLTFLKLPLDNILHHFSFHDKIYLTKLMLKVRYKLSSVNQ